MGVLFSYSSCIVMSLITIQGSSVPLVVKWADTEKERQARRAQKAQSQASNVSNPSSMQQPSIFGALPMGYMSPYNGYGYQVRSYFLMLGNDPLYNGYGYQFGVLFFLFLVVTNRPTDRA